LSRADLRRTDLRGAKFGGANLSDVTGLDEAILKGVDLKDATGLSGKQFTSADLTGAILPDGIAGFEGLAHVAEISQNARKIFFGLLLACVYSWLTIATTTDARLLTNSASSPLPIIQTEIPIAWFYWAAPLILLSVYFYFHLYLLRLWEALASLPAIFPDGKPLDQRAYPWLLNGLVRGHVKLLRQNRPALSRLQNVVSIGLAWWFVPVTLMAFWVRYLPRQDWTGTVFLIACVIAAASFGSLSYVLTRRTLRGQDMPFSWKQPWRDGRSYLCAASVLFAVGLSGSSYGAINGTRLDPWDYGKRHVALTDLDLWVPHFFQRFGFNVFADLRESDISTKPANWTGLAERPTKELEYKPDLIEKARVELGQVKGAKLTRANLRHADAVGAFLSKADLRLANLQEADLREVNLEFADLQEADLESADLEMANLLGANLRRGTLLMADLEQANLWKANLQGAILPDTNLRGAKLWEADLKQANLGGGQPRRGRSPGGRSPGS
jgi:uncharacterized protein YjbI with pentapeptide repeats